MTYRTHKWDVEWNNSALNRRNDASLCWKGWNLTPRLQRKTCRDKGSVTLHYINTIFAFRHFRLFAKLIHSFNSKLHYRTSSVCTSISEIVLHQSYLPIVINSPLLSEHHGCALPPLKKINFPIDWQSLQRSSGGRRSSAGSSRAPPAARSASTSARSVAPSANRGAPPNRAPVPAQQSNVPATQSMPQSSGPGMLSQMASTAGGVAIGSTIGHGLSQMLFGGRSESTPAETPQDQTFAQQELVVLVAYKLKVRSATRVWVMG